jgi:3-methyladenine DNA glycosylase AlkD
MSASLYSDLTTALSRHSNSRVSELDKRFHKYEYRSLGLGAPKFYEIVKSFRAQIKETSCAEARRTALSLYKTHIEEYGQAASFIIGQRLDCFTPDDFPFLDKCTNEFGSWSMVDGFAPVMQALLLKYPRETLKLLKKWNMDASLWKRRLSVVVFTRKIGASGKFTKEGLALCDAIIDDQEDLVRKGIGWALKDLMRGDKKTVLAYVKDLRKRGVSSTITLYALRDIKGPEHMAILKK